MSGASRQLDTIRIDTLRTPRTTAADFIMSRLGLNFRPGNPIYEDGMWRVPIRAMIPASPDVVPRQDDQLFYRFESFTEILLDDDLKIVEAPTLSQLKGKFEAEISRLFSKIEKMILDYGSDKWGRVAGIRYFLNPLNAIVSQALSLQSISRTKLEQQGYLWYGDLLKEMHILEESNDNPDNLRRTNELVAIADKYRREKGAVYLDETATEVISMVCSRFYDRIRETTPLLPSYVDATVAYYVKAVKVKKLIPMSVSELEYAYNVLGRRIQDEHVKFYGKVADLVSAGFLQWHSLGVVIGIDPIYSRVRETAPEIDDSVRLLKAVA